jgi:hypothetical protein
MGKHREIRTEEIVLLQFLLNKIGEKSKTFSIKEMVDEYEGGKMGSISFSLDGIATYASDLIQVDYVDADGTEVVITLTCDTENELLDLDFWKLDFSALISYPIPEKIKFKNE